MNEIGKQYLDQVVDSVLAVKAVFEKPLTLEAGHPEVSMCSVFSAYDTSTGKDVPFVHVFSGIQELANAVEVPLIKEIVDQDVSKDPISRRNISNDN